MPAAKRRTAAQIAEADAADGAKPGSQPAPGGRLDEGFDAPERSKKRESAPFVLGDQTFTRRRKNWKMTRELRTLLRKQERSMISISRVNTEISELPTGRQSEQKELELEDRIDALQDEGDIASYEIVALLLRDEEGNSPAVEMIQEELDVEDVAALAQWFAGGGEPVADPTETATS